MLSVVPGARRVIVVSDSHLSRRTPESDLNWSAVLRHVGSARPDLVVHAGDLSLDGAHDRGDLEYARSRLDQLEVPWLAVPGNHDVGDNPSGSAPDQDGIDVGRRERWLAAVGADWWAAEAGGWRLIGVNAQLFGSGLAAEVEQWAWLEAELRDAPAATRLALVTHKPVAADEAELAAAPVYRFVPVAARRRLADLSTSRRIDLVLSGHVHQYRELRRGGMIHLWAPTTWAVLPDAAQATVGTKRSGILAVELTDAGEVRHDFVQPDGLRQLTITTDIADPYHRA
jgi:3',5'-cyclic AMP phosphodiesterase CpdA